MTHLQLPSEPPQPPNAFWGPSCPISAAEHRDTIRVGLQQLVPHKQGCGAPQMHLACAHTAANWPITAQQQTALSSLLQHCQPVVLGEACMQVLHVRNEACCIDSA